ncbi:hypothetical protein CCM_02043 [Cordyceps militaris CM01]|uniref:Uncharacterized protein n=1 Tax=Cordyceps militaris (strain CM01) TaxID=983644 RepID=G3JCA9_CORMM|nr:uncharacterized protein CCM_02043 [Cordyceps militaris CM01]EGX93774.1 hypothetical protein CCM_02043 [Cordyceps militaris CM01]
MGTAYVDTQRAPLGLISSVISFEDGQGYRRQGPVWIVSPGRATADGGGVIPSTAVNS